MVRNWWKRLLATPASRRERRRASARLAVESLETRLVPAVKVNLVNGQLQAIGDNGGNLIVVQHSGSNTVINGQSTPDSLITNGILIQSGKGADTINIQSTVKAITVDGEGGLDKANVGHDGTARDVQAPVNIGVITNFGPGKSIALSVDDSKDMTGRNVTLNSDVFVTPDGLGFFQGTIKNLAGADITFLPFQLSSLTLSGGTGGNTFVVSDTGPAVPTTINTGSGNDKSFVQATSGALTLNGVNGKDTLDVGAGFKTYLINGAIDVTNSGGHTAINIDDSGDDGSSTITLQNTGLKASISGATPAVITYVQNDLSTLTLNAGAHGNTFNVIDTPQAFAGAQTILNTGTGIDTVNVQGTIGALTVNGQNGRDTVNVGLNGDMQSIKGNLNITNTFSFSAINLNDQADNTGRVVTLDANNNTGVATITGLTAPTATITYKTFDLSTLTVNTGGGADTITVNDTAVNISGPATTVLNTGGGIDTVTVRATSGPLTVNTGAGNDIINVGSTSNTINGIQGALTVNGGQADTDTLNINDAGSLLPNVYTQTATSLTRSGAATITFGGIENLQIHKGAQIAGAPLAQNLALTPSIKAGQSATLTGQLTDADGDNKLTLTVDWGDGSPPQTTEPGQDPFSLKHMFKKAGTYTVRAIWTDSTGASNFQERIITVTKA